jgi:hypothetical protein
MGYPSREEIKVLMDELLNAPEGCLPWEPIPARFSGSWQVDVIHVDEDYGEDRQPGETSPSPWLPISRPQIRCQATAGLGALTLAVARRIAAGSSTMRDQRR